MKKKLLAVSIISGLALLPVAPVTLAEEAAMESGAAQQGAMPARAVAAQLMTEEERRAFMEKMRAAKTPQEREQIRQEHHQLMMQRAREKNIELPDMPPTRPGMGNGPGMGKGQGMGQGQGMGRGMGQGMKGQPMPAQNRPAPGMKNRPMQGQPGDERIFGSRLMTEQERNEFREKMRAATSDQEREQIRREHHQMMMERARERKVDLRDELPPRKPPMRSGEGAESEQGEEE